LSKAHIDEDLDLQLLASGAFVVLCANPFVYPKALPVAIVIAPANVVVAAFAAWLVGAEHGLGLGLGPELGLAPFHVPGVLGYGELAVSPSQLLGQQHEDSSEVANLSPGGLVAANRC
jgi:hypothetical protein